MTARNQLRIAAQQVLGFLWILFIVALVGAGAVVLIGFWAALIVGVSVGVGAVATWLGAI